MVCEPFTQWVVEDSFTMGRPPWEEVGVRLVEDVEPYELMKLRLLNASHQALCYLGHLAGYRFVHEVCRDPLFASFLRRYMTREAVPTLPPVSGVDLDRYVEQLLERFSNPEVSDTLARLCADTSDRIPVFLMPVVREDLAAGRDVGHAAAVVASWARYAEGTDEQGRPIDVVDRLRDPLMTTAARWREDPLAFLRHRDLFGDLVDNPRFTELYTATLTALHTRGAHAVLEDLALRAGSPVLPGAAPTVPGRRSVGPPARRRHRFSLPAMRRARPSPISAGRGRSFRLQAAVSG